MDIELLKIALVINATIRSITILATAAITKIRSAVLEGMVNSSKPLKIYAAAKYPNVMDKNKNPRNGLNGQQALNTAVMPTKPTKRYIMVLVCSGETPNNGAMRNNATTPMVVATAFGMARLNTDGKNRPVTFLPSGSKDIKNAEYPSMAKSIKVI